MGRAWNSHLIVQHNATEGATNAARGPLDFSDSRSRRTYFVALTLADQIPDHRIGIVYGRTEAGWLISPDFRESNRLGEGRYQWQFVTNRSLEARIRQRRDLARLASAGRERKDLDFYLRVTLRF